MCKKQQMAWSRRGAQYLLHVNTAVINGQLHRYTGHGPRQCSIAAWPPTSFRSHLNRGLPRSVVYDLSTGRHLRCPC
jgi:hypothetical protein